MRILAMEDKGIRKEFTCADNGKYLNVVASLIDHCSYTVTLRATGLSSREASGLFDHIVRPYFYEMRSNISDSYEGNK